MKKGYMIAAVACMVICAVCLAVTFIPYDAPDPIQEMVESFDANDSDKNPIDFDKIQKKNLDIYAWLNIPGTEISYPILQHPKDDEYYLTHNSVGDQAKAGSLFTQSTYNGKDFSDPVTVVYGHQMRSGARFGNLQKIFADRKGFNKHKNIVVYMPEKQLRYQIFAAVPYESEHILQKYDFSDNIQFDKFIKTVYDIESGYANFKDGVSITSEDRILILSTCLRWEGGRRYLVLAKLTDSDVQP